MFSLLKPSRTMVGVDISSSAVKLLELSSRDVGLCVQRFAVASLPQGVVVEKEIKEPEILAEILSDLFDRSQTQAQSAVVALPDSAVINKVLQIDADLSEDEMEAEILMRSDNFIPYPIEEVSLDFDVLAPSADQAGCVDVMVVASRAEQVREREAIFSKVGLSVEVVDIESYAIERACQLFGDSGSDRRVIGVIDIGAVMTSLTILSGDSAVYSREEIFGGEQLNQLIQQRYALSFEEAELAKTTGDLADGYEKEVLTPFIESVVLQVRRLLQGYFSVSQQSRIDRLYLTGGSAQIGNLTNCIEEKLGIQTQLADLFSHFRFADTVAADELQSNAPKLMLSCGLAMRNLKQWQR